MAITKLDKKKPHFRARITILRGKDGEEIFFGFPSTGIRTAAVEMHGVPSVGVLGIYHIPRARIRSGESIEADCTAAWEGESAPVIPVGCRFRLWGMAPEAEGEVISLYPTPLDAGRTA